MSRAILPLADGLFVLQRTFARRFEADIGVPWGIGLSVPFSFHTITNGHELDSSTVSVVRGKAPVEIDRPWPEHLSDDALQLGHAPTRLGGLRHRTDFLSLARPGDGAHASHDLEHVPPCLGHRFPAEFDAIARPIQETLLACLDDTLVPADMLTARRGSFDTHRKLMAQLDEVAALAGDKPLYSEDLSRALGVAVRTLQLAARTMHGMSLHQYLRLKRLWSTRIQLMTGGPGSSVKAAALGNGFWHLGDFARSYRTTFGEAPSETLARGRRL
ncbi:helix-turn-helix domain-containing protein [Bradyrhizobium betae]|uniref:AraC family transcriptional regulator n=1 Tax=Bradyrhizobium betae TaxID=244734 RepID=UPI003D664201